MSHANLDALCARYGIASHYRDFWQQEHAVPEATRRAVLAAMGVRTDGEATDARTSGDASTAHASLNARPVVVRTTQAQPDVEVAMPSEAGDVALAWSLALESGEWRHGSVARSEHDGGTRARCLEVGVLPAGYHCMIVHREGDRDAALARRSVIACPPRCQLTSDVAPGARLFGPAVQLYALRSKRNWGIGDFTDLAHLAIEAAAHGAGFVGLNPLHELFLDRPEAASPYSPSSRRSVSPLYIDVEAVEDYAECEDVRRDVEAPAFRERLAALRDAPLVDYAGVTEAKLPVLRRLFDHFLRRHLRSDTDRAREFRAWLSASANLVLAPARFDALQAMLAAGDRAIWGWPAWPEEYRACDSEAVRAFVRDHAADVDFHLWLQWQADRQLARAHAVARSAGMPVGLYRDLAVGANPGGAETWQEPSRYALGVHVGAPPDEFNRKGQDWGLPPWIPHRLPEGDFAPWVRLLRANMRHAGGLRIDHVMALLRLYWIPAGNAPTEGTYVHYPLEDLLAVLALESERNECIVVGEDLGTVPGEVREALARNGVHSYRVLYFEHGHDGGFAAPSSFPAQALVTVSTHDLPTLQGFWQATDLAARDALDLFPSSHVREQQYAERTAERPRLLAALAREGLAPWPEREPGRLDLVQVVAVHRYLARAPSVLMTVQLEDVFGETAQVNLPATTDAQYPNWRRKITVALEDWEADGRFAALCAALRNEGRGSAMLEWRDRA